MAGLTLKETAAASVPTPATDKATVFIDSADGLPKYKNDAGTVVSLGGSLADGDYGDVTVSSSGTVITIDDDAVTLPKIANQADQTILGNNTGGSASPSALTASQVRTLLGLVPGTDVQAYDSDLAAIAALSPSNDDIIQRKAGAWTNRTLAQLASDLGVPTLAGTNTWTAQNTFAAGTLTASTPAQWTQTWNSSGVAFTALDLNVTDTASNAASILLNLRIGGTSKWNVTKAGKAFGTTDSSAPTYSFIGQTTTGTGYFNSGVLFWAAGNYPLHLQGSAAKFASNVSVGWTSGTDSTGAADTSLVRVIAKVVGVRDGSTGGGALGLIEMTAPAAPSANGVYVYAEDNGAGKTRLMAIFPSGAAQQVAIEP